VAEICLMTSMISLISVISLGAEKRTPWHFFGEGHTKRMGMNRKQEEEGECGQRTGRTNRKERAGGEVKR
jgi:hypothetical protein